MTVGPRTHHQIPLERRELLSNCRQCKNYHGQKYGGNLLVCGMHPYGPSGDTCDDFEKIDRSKWVVNIPSRESTAWGATHFGFSCYNVETGVRAAFSLFAASEEDAVQLAQRVLYGGVNERHNVMGFTVSYPTPPAELQFAALWEERSSDYSLPSEPRYSTPWGGRGPRCVDATDFRDNFHQQAISEDLTIGVAELASQEWGGFAANADSPTALAIAEGLSAAFNSSADTAPPTSPEP